MSFNLTGLPSDNPIPVVAREFRFAQGPSTGGGTDRSVVLVAPKTSAGSETLDTVDMARPVVDDADAQARFGKRSAWYWMYRKYTAVDNSATIYGCAPTEQAGAAAAVTFTCTTTADAESIIFIDWAGERLSVPVAVGDTAINIAANIAAKVAADPFVPFTAAQLAPANDHKVTFTAANVGPVGNQILAALRISFSKTIATGIAKGSVTASTSVDDLTAAALALANVEIYYHVLAVTSTSSITTTDNGLGEYIDMIRQQALPANGKDQIVIAGAVGTQSQATAVATSSGGNAVYGVIAHAENSDWHSGMLAAHVCAVKRSQEMLHPCANLSGYTNSDTTPFAIPAPYDVNDRPTKTEQAADLNNGVTSIAFTPTGAAYIVRQITMYSWVGSSATKDYRAREGHIPSGIHYSWNYLRGRYNAVKQPFVSDDLKPGQIPVGGTMYPSTIKRLVSECIDVLTGPLVNGAPVLDPGRADAMKASIQVTSLADGFGVAVAFEPVRHNNKALFLVSQGGPAY